MRSIQSGENDRSVAIQEASMDLADTFFLVVLVALFLLILLGFAVAIAL